MNFIAIPQTEFDLLKLDIQQIKDSLSMHSPAADDLISEAELLEKLGSPNKSTTWRWEKKGVLLPIKIGANKMYRLSDLIALQSNAKLKRTYKYKSHG